MHALNPEIISTIYIFLNITIAIKMTGTLILNIIVLTVYFLRVDTHSNFL